MQPAHFPALQEGHYALVCAEVATGIVLSLSGAWALGNAPRYRTCSTLEEARVTAEDIVAARRDWEVSVLDHTGTATAVFRAPCCAPRS